MPRVPTLYGPDDPPDAPTCAYCRTELTDDSRTFGNLFERTRTATGRPALCRRRRAYCSTTCASRDQMSHEG